MADILLKDNDLQINTLSVRTGMAVGRLAAVMFSLEMKGLVKCRAGESLPFNKKLKNLQKL